MDEELDPDDPALLYVQIAGIIEKRIKAGAYTLKLPGERDIAEEFRVSYITVRHATAILRERGLIISIHGKGTYVAPGHRQPGPTPGQTATTALQPPRPETSAPAGARRDHSR